jgi:RNA methyltransferase, TrmH family
MRYSPVVSYDITSPSNDRIKWLVRLRERRNRDAEGLFVVEGERLYTRAVESGLTPSITFVSGDVVTVGETVSVAPDVLDKASYRSRSDTMIGVFPQFELSLSRIELGGDPLVLVVENIEKPGNLGAMLRTASVAGADGVVAVGDTVDPFNPNVLRSSTGALFSTPLAMTMWDELEPWLADRGMTVVATAPDATESLFEVDLTRPTAVLIGAEDEGLSKRALEVASVTVSIPQTKGTTDSLNASVAAGIVLFEAVRQRLGG